MNLDLPPGIDSNWSNSYSGLRSFSVFLIFRANCHEKNSKYVYLVLKKPPSLANPYVLVLSHSEESGSCHRKQVKAVSWVSLVNNASHN